MKPHAEFLLTCAQRARRSCIDWRYESTCREGDVMTDMPLALYPQGLYDVRPAFIIGAWHALRRRMRSSAEHGYMPQSSPVNCGMARQAVGQAAGQLQLLGTRCCLCTPCMW